MKEKKNNAKTRVIKYLDNLNSFFVETVKAMPDVPESHKADLVHMAQVNRDTASMHLDYLSEPSTERERLNTKSMARRSIMETLDFLVDDIKKLPLKTEFIDLDQWFKAVKTYCTSIVADIDTIRVLD